MKYSILVPTYNRIKDLKRCLSSLKSAVDMLPESVRVEILVSDNHSNDGTRDFLNRETKIESKVNVSFKAWSNSENIGARANVKKLITESSGEYLFFLTDDDIVFPSIFEKLDEFLGKGKYSFVKIPNITHLVKSKRSYYYGPNKDLSDRTNHLNFISIMGYTHVLSGCVLKRDRNIIKEILESDNVYPSILMCSMNAGKCGALSEPLILHQWENEIFWDKDVDMTSKETQAMHTAQDQQLAMLFVDEHFFTEPEVKELYNFFIKRHGFVAKSLINKFGVPDSCETVSAKIKNNQPIALAKYR